MHAVVLEPTVAETSGTMVVGLTLHALPTCSNAKPAGRLPHVRWISPKTGSAYLVLSCMTGAASGGCGRIGFEALSDDFNAARPVGDPADRSPESDATGKGEDASLSGVSDASAAGAVDGGAPSDNGANDSGTLPANDCTLVPDALTCSNFENGLASNMFIETSGDGSVSMSEGYVDAETTESDGWARVGALFPAVTSGSIYLRMSMYIPGDAELSLVNFADLMENDLESSAIDFNFRNDELEVYAHQTEDSYVCSGCIPPRDTWFCFRARVDLGDGDGRVRTWIEDSLMHDLEGVDTLSAGGMQKASIGVVWVTSSQNAAHLMIDDFAVSTMPLTACP